MPLIYIHLSDIHFGQERGGSIYVNDDVKEQLLADAQEFIAKTVNKKADGIIISGDIAYAGKQHEYDAAGVFLDRLTAAVGCPITAVQLVPGNHDIERDKITTIVQETIDKIIKGGDNELDRYQESEDDRDFLYRQFGNYRKFAEAYNCPLDNGGIIKSHSHKIIEIAPNRKLLFFGVNTALICSKSKLEQGGLILGKRQRIIPIQPGCETVVIAHHPLSWLQDSEEAGRYIKARARVFISGHEHKSSHKCDPVCDDADLLMLASGAAVPPEIKDGFNYCYNILEFGWDEARDGLLINIYGRTWDNEHKKFVADQTNFVEGKANHFLKCPNFKKVPLEIKKDEDKTPSFDSKTKTDQSETENILNSAEVNLVLLRFFRDLSSGERTTILIEMDALPKDWDDTLTHTLERAAFDNVVEAGKLEEMHIKINQIIQSK